MSRPDSFEQRYHDAAQGVYEAMNHPQGDIGPSVHEALLEAALYASADEQPQEQ